MELKVSFSLNLSPMTDLLFLNLLKKESHQPKENTSCTYSKTTSASEVALDSFLIPVVDC